MKRTPDRATGQLAAVFRAAMATAAQLKAEGMPDADRRTYIANALKAAWPKTREEPWHCLCDACEDAGWLPRTCVHGSCGRPFRLPGQRGDDWTGRGRCQPGHTYVVPCTCAKGLSYRQVLYPAAVADVPTPARVRQPKFRKFGR